MHKGYKLICTRLLYLYTCVYKGFRLIFIIVLRAARFKLGGLREGPRLCKSELAVSGGLTFITQLAHVGLEIHHGTSEFIHSGGTALRA